ncbi:MAG: hypothetical protein ACR2IE_13000 [Candidatus Sumerlaeaceae bacterium]
MGPSSLPAEDCPACTCTLPPPPLPATSSGDCTAEICDWSCRNSCAANGFTDYCALLYAAAIRVQNCILCTDAESFKNDQGDPDPSLKWQEGDIAFLGDTITYLFRGDFRYAPPNSFNPIVPLSVNFGSLGLGTFRLRMMLDRLFSPGTTPDSYTGFGRPSTIVMLAGFNGLDYGFAPCRQPAQFAQQEELCEDIVCGTDMLSDGCNGNYDVLERLVRAMAAYNAQNVRVIVQGYHLMAHGQDGAALKFRDKAIRDRAVRILNRGLSDLSTSYGLSFVPDPSAPHAFVPHAFVPHYADFPPYTSARHPDYVVEDGIHLTPLGNQAYLQRLVPFLFDRPAFGPTVNVRTISYHGPTKQSGSGLTYRVVSYPLDTDRRIVVNCPAPATAAVYDPLKYSPNNNAIATGTALEVNNSDVTSSPIIGQSPQVIVKFGFTGTANLSVDNYPTNDAAVRAHVLTSEQNGSMLHGPLTYNAPNGVWYKVTVPVGDTLKVFFSDPGGAIPVIKVYRATDTANALVQNAADPLGKWTVSYRTKATAQYLVSVRSPDLTRQFDQQLTISWGNQAPGAVTLMPPGGSARQASPSVATGAGSMIAAWNSDGNVVVASSINKGRSWSPATIAYNGALEPAVTSQPLKIVFGNNEWRIIFATATKIKLIRMPAAAGAWDPAQELSDTDLTCSGTAPTNPHLILRPVGSGAEWSATWIRNGQEGDGSVCSCCRTVFTRTQPLSGSWQNSSTLPINANVIPAEPDLTPYASPAFMTVDYSQSAGTTVSESSMDIYVVKPATSDPPHATDDTELRVLMGGTRQIVRSTTSEIVNPQICWVPRATSGFWLAVWSMQENWRGGEDLDLYYSTTPNSSTAWTEPKLLLPDFAKVDREDDRLDDLLADSAGQIHLCWRRGTGNANGAIYMAHADPGGGTNSQPAQLVCASPYVLSPQEGLVDNADARLAMDGTDLLAVWNAKGQGNVFGTDGAILSVAQNKSQFNAGTNQACPKTVPNDEPLTAQNMQSGVAFSGALTACGSSTCCTGGCDTIPDAWYKTWLPTAGTTLRIIAADPNATSANPATVTVFQSLAGEALDPVCPVNTLVQRASANSSQASAGRFIATWITSAPCWVYVRLESASASDAQLISALVGNSGGGITTSHDWQLYD